MVMAEFLGVQLAAAGAMSSLSLATEIERGLPLTALDRVAESVAPGDGSFPFRLVPRATLARRRRQDVGETPGSRLTSEEGSRVARLAAIWATALEVWGAPEAARDFLFRPHAMLDGSRPIDIVLANEFGGSVVDNILGRLRYGAAA